MGGEYFTDENLRTIAERLHAAGYLVYLVGGGVRDRLMGREPKDADLATTARPGQVMELFPGASDAGVEFGRVLVQGMDVLTLRRDGQYKDSRRPSWVAFTDSITEDLARRDFTVNAMAVRYPNGALIDPFGGMDDLRGRVLRAVGEPDIRFTEDSLRLLRLVRFVAQLGFSVDPATAASAKKNAAGLRAIPAERIRDELSKLLLGDQAADGLTGLRDLGLLAYVLPELAPAVGCAQNTPHHYLDVFEHTVGVVAAVPADLGLRLSALLHDVGKPAAKESLTGEKDHFYRHEIIGVDIAQAAMERLKYPNVLTERVVRNVRWHMFNYTPRTSAGRIRRFVAEVGMDAVADLVALRRADRSASTTNDGIGYSAERLLAVVADMEQQRQAFTVEQLAINGHDVMEALGIPPSQRVGQALRSCLDLVLERPESNTREDLLALVKGDGRNAVG